MTFETDQTKMGNPNQTMPLADMHIFCHTHLPIRKKLTMAIIHSSGATRLIEKDCRMA